MDIVGEYGIRVSTSESSGRRLGKDFVSLAQDLLAISDILLILGSSYISAFIYTGFLAPGADFDPAGFNSLFWDSYGLATLFGALSSAVILHGVQRPRATHSVWEALGVRRLIRRFSMWLGVLLMVGFVTRSLDHLPRAWVGLWVGGSFFGVLVNHFIFVQHLRVLGKRGLLRETIAIVGAGAVADRLIEHLRQSKAGGVEIVGLFDDRGAGRIPGDCSQPTGTVADLVDLGKRKSIDWILLTFPSTADARLLLTVHQLKTLAVAVALCPQHIGLSLPYRVLDYVHNDIPVQMLADRPLRRWNWVMKEAEDLILAGLMLVVLTPLMAIIALAIKLDSPGPVIFRQRREGWNNRDFEVFKFRSMYWQPQSSSVLHQTSRNDARITRLGRFLRRTSLDELPQLFNVLRREMSVIGPRPHAVNMRTEDSLGQDIISVYAHRYRMKPGISGWAQVHGLRGCTDTVSQLEQRVKYDLFYIENWSLSFDLKIIVMTFMHVIFGKNAF